MKSLKRLSAVAVLSCLLSLPVLAGETPTGPSAPPAPGETQAPPSAFSNIATDSPATGETNTRSASDSVDVIYVAGAAIRTLLLF